MRFAKSALAALTAAVGAYGFTTFVLWNPNPAEWLSIERYALASLVLICGAFAGLLTYWNVKP